MSVAPFDFAAWPHVTREDVATRAQLHAARALVPLAEIARALESLAGAPVSIAARHAASFDPTECPAHAIGVALAPAGDPARTFLVEVEPALARELVSRALRQPAGPLADPRQAPRPEVRGAFAAVLIAALRTCAPPLRLVAEAGLPERACSIRLAVTVAGAAFDARVSFPPLPVSAPAPDLDRLGEAPIALRVVATSCLATREEIAALEPGDVFLPPAEWLDGPVDLVAADEERGLSARLAFGSKVVLRTEPSANHPMTTESKAPLDIALDVPVVVRVEVGSVEMKAREWAALSEGDVISTGVKVGSHAVLRIGGVAVAHGELVNVDGETGVRIVGTIKR